MGFNRLRESKIQDSGVASRFNAMYHSGVVMGEKVQKKTILGTLELLERANLERQRVERVHDSEVSTALNDAASREMISACKHLIEKLKLDVNLKDQNGNTHLINAIMSLKLPTSEYLIDYQYY